MTAATEIIPHNVEAEVVGQQFAIVTESKGYIVIASDEHRDRAVEFGRKLKTMRSTVAELYEGPIAQAHALHKDLCRRRNALDGPLADAETAVRRGVGQYEARKQAEIEAKREAELAEIRRKEEEAERERQRLIEESRRSEEEFALAEAEKLAAEGRIAEADALIEKPIMPTQPIPDPAPPEPVKLSSAYKAPQGVRTRQNWKFRIVNPALIPREYLIPNETQIGQMVRAMKDKTNIPGIEVYPEAASSFAP